MLSKIHPFLNTQNLIQIFKYGILGVLNNLFFYLLFLSICFIGVKPIIAMTVTYITGAISSFILNKNLIFNFKTNQNNIIIYKFILTHVFGIFVNCSLMMILMDVFSYSYQFSAFIGMIAVAISTFFGFKFFIFIENNLNPKH
jgi:hypothetical protein